MTIDFLFGVLLGILAIGVLIGALFLLIVYYISRKSKQVEKKRVWTMERFDPEKWK